METKRAPRSVKVEFRGEFYVMDGKSHGIFALLTQKGTDQQKYQFVARSFSSGKLISRLISAGQADDLRKRYKIELSYRFVNADKGISKLSVGNDCRGSTPCQHQIRIEYKDGKIEERLSPAPEAVEYLRGMGEQIPKHFSEYQK